MKWHLYKEKLLWLRLNQGWSQEEAALRCGAPDKKTYHLWETGKIERPQARNLLKIVRGFKLQATDEIILKPTDAPEPELSALYGVHFNSRALDASARAAKAPMGTSRHKLICFDMDATLIHGLELSPRAIWEALGDEENNRKHGIRSYYTGKFTYTEWCLWVAEFFRHKGLTQERFREIVRQYHLAPCLREGLTQLKQQGFKLAIVSNGLGGFMDELFPDWSEYFDDFLVNRLIFSETGLVQSVIPSPYGIEGKVDAIRSLGEKYAFSMNEVIFVGSSFLNRQVAFETGLTIGYANPSAEISDFFDANVEDDNFKNVVDLISRHTEPVHIPVAS